MRTKKATPTGNIHRLLKERGEKALKIAKKAILEEKLESKEVAETLRFFTGYACARLKNGKRGREVSHPSKITNTKTRHRIAIFHAISVFCPQLLYCSNRA